MGRYSYFVLKLRENASSFLLSSMMLVMSFFVVEVDVLYRFEKVPSIPSLLTVSIMKAGVCQMLFLQLFM